MLQLKLKHAQCKVGIALLGSMLVTFLYSAYNNSKTSKYICYNLRKYFKVFHSNRKLMDGRNLIRRLLSSAAKWAIIWIALNIEGNFSSHGRSKISLKCLHYKTLLELQFKKSEMKLYFMVEYIINYCRGKTDFIYLNSRYKVINRGCRMR